MEYCKKCGNQLEDAVHFCPKCGNPTDLRVKTINSVQEQFKKMGCWQKGLIVFLVLAFIGFLGEKCGGSDTKRTAETDISKITEQVVDETQKVDKEQVRKQKEEEKEERIAKDETERQAKELETSREEQEKNNNLKKIADMAYQKGYNKRKSTRELISSEEAAYQDYILRYNEVPNEGADPERWELFKKEYMRGFTQAAQDMLKDAY